MSLSLTFQLGRGQTATSAASALAARNFRFAVRPFCADVHLEFSGIVNGDPVALAKLARLGDFDLSTLTKSSFIVEERRTFTLNGQRLVGLMLERQRPVACPLCLVEDMENGRYAPEIDAFARPEWSITSYRTCTMHNVATIPIAPVPQPSLTHDFAVLVRQNLAEIRRLASDPERRQASAFEHNLLARVLGSPVESNWLNSLGFSASARACELFGAVLNFGTRFNMRQLSPADWARAGAAGFDLLKAGIETVRDFLLNLQRAPALGATSGPQQMFGRIYQWLEFGSDDRDLEPVRTMLRDHIVETLPVGPGDIVLGQPVQQRRLHSIRSAALQHGVHQVTARKILTLAGIAPAERGELSDDRILFAPDPADALLERVARGIPAKEIHSYLDVSRTHMKHLIERRDIRPILDIDGLEALYDTADLDAFIDRVAAKADVVDQPTPDQVPLTEAVKRACCGVGEVLDLVWSGRLKWVGRLAAGRGYGALLVSLGEVKVMTELPPPDGVVANFITSDFGIPHRAILEMVRRGFLPTVDAINPKNRCPMKVIPATDYNRFKANYVSLRDLSRASGKWSRHIIPEMESIGVVPLPEWTSLGAYIYRREELP